MFYQMRKLLFRLISELSEHKIENLKQSYFINNKKKQRALMLNKKLIDVDSFNKNNLGKYGE